jgi:hypothetical protein
MPPRHTETYVKVIEHVEHAGTSAMGNPTYRIRFTDGHTALTETDGGVGYAVTNYTNSRHAGREVAVKAHARSGRIWDMTWADGSRA